MIRDDCWNEFLRLYRGNKREHALTAERFNALHEHYQQYAVSVLRAAIDTALREPVMPSMDRLDALMEHAAEAERVRVNASLDSEAKRLMRGEVTQKVEHGDPLYARMNWQLTRLVFEGRVAPASIPEAQGNLDLHYSTGQGETWINEMLRAYPRATNTPMPSRLSLRDVSLAEAAEVEERRLNAPLTEEEEQERDRQLAAYRAGALNV